MSAQRTLGLIVSTMAHAVITVSAGAQTYSVTPIGPLPGEPGPTLAWDINDAGVVFGTAYIDGSRQSRCFIDDDGDLIVFGAESDQPYLWSGALNNTPALVGMAMVPSLIGTQRDSFVTGPAFLPELFPLFPATFASGATDINNNGPPWAVGMRDTGDSIGIGAFAVRHAYLVFVDGNPNPPVQLGTLGGPFSRAEALNDNRDVVGGSLVAGGPMRAFIRRFSNGQMQDLGSLGGGISYANDISNAGAIVGWSRLADGSTHAFIHEDNIMTSLGTLGGNYSEALGTNEIGAVVGMSLNVQGKPRAFLHDGASMIDLNTRIPAESGWVLQHARAVNEGGAIVGWGRFAGETRAFLLTPQPHLLGDINRDGVLDADDRAAFCAAVGSSLGEPAFNALADLNGDETIDHLDLAVFNGIVPACDGDVATSVTFAPPPDGVTDAADLAYLLGAWASEPSCADSVSSTTFTPPPDGTVDAADLAFLLGAWGVCE